MAGAELPSSTLGVTPAGPDPDDAPEGDIARLAASITGWAERWVPDAFVFALAATVVVVGAAMVTGAAGPLEVVRLWGKGFWSLLTFAMQMCLVVITGYVLATTAPVHRVIVRLATITANPRAAIAFVAFMAMVSSWFNWGFSLMFAAMLARETARRVPGVDYRAVAAASFLGLGSVWAQGLSGSAALQMATPAALPERIRTIVAGPGGVVPGGLIPLTDTIFLWQSLVSVAVEIVIVTALVYAIAPRPARARTASDMGLVLPPPPDDAKAIEAAAPTTSRLAFLERSPLLSMAFVLIAGTYLVDYFARAEHLLAAVSLDTINLGFLTLGVALHRTPLRLMRAVREATPAVWGILLQFPLYAGMAAVISETHLNGAISDLFVRVSTPTSFPALIATYSAVLGVFVPSGGGKWVIEAPYVMQAAHDHGVHLGFMVAVYDLGEALANLIQPFWMLPMLGLFGLRARDVMGYTLIVFLVLAPVVLALVTALGTTLGYPL